MDRQGRKQRGSSVTSASNLNLIRPEMALSPPSQDRARTGGGANKRTGGRGGEGRGRGRGATVIHVLKSFSVSSPKLPGISAFSIMSLAFFSTSLR